MAKILRPLIAFFILPAIIFLTIWGSQAVVKWRTAPYRFTDNDRLPQGALAVVFGAGVLPKTGEVGPALKSRLDAAFALYKAGKVTSLFFSGDSQTAGHDEITPMVAYATAHNIPTKALLTDGKGISTYDTCWRLKNVYKVTKATLVTSDYHLPRAVYTCRTLGVDAVGLATAQSGSEYESTQRESLATIKMLIDLYVAPPSMKAD
jgi:vancomycin permeability regulator SanA